MNLLGQKLRFWLTIRKERRLSPRIPLHETLYLDYLRPPDFGRGTGEGKNLSSLGILFASDGFIPVGTPLDLGLHFYPTHTQGAPEVVVQSRVVRCSQSSGQRHYRIACVFDHPSPSTQDAIQSFIRWLKKGNR